MSDAGVGALDCAIIGGVGSSLSGCATFGVSMGDATGGVLMGVGSSGRAAGGFLWTILSRIGFSWRDSLGSRRDTGLVAAIFFAIGGMTGRWTYSGADFAGLTSSLTSSVGDGGLFAIAGGAATPMRTFKLVVPGGCGGVISLATEKVPTAWISTAQAKYRHHRGR